MGSIEALTHSMDDRDDAVEFILLGTGTSSTLPHVDCLTRPPHMKPCKTCLSTLAPEGRKNKRANTSAVARVRGRDGEYKTIVIDVGKSFLQAAVEWFPKYGLRRIDAVLITHGHADAMNGLDDLRVPHGFCGAKPVKAVAALADPRLEQGSANASPWSSGLPGTPVGTRVPTPTKREEFMCLGFVIQNAVAYISDVSRLSDDVMEYLRSSGSTPGRPPPVLILDCLALKEHLSHLSLAQSVEYARQLNAQRTYLVGFSHSVSHEEYETLLAAVGGRPIPAKELTEGVKKGLDTLDLQGDRIWIRPGFDGLQIFVSEDGRARDTAYFDYGDGQ